MGNGGRQMGNVVMEYEHLLHGKTDPSLPESPSPQQAPTEAVPIRVVAFEKMFLTLQFQFYRKANTVQTVPGICCTVLNLIS